MPPADPERLREMMGEVERIVTRDVDDPLYWARNPRSDVALDAVIKGARTHGGLRRVLAEHVANGIVTEDGVILKKFHACAC
jgi:hypothetical protein